VPIVVLSVRAGEAEKVAALDRGANDYVTKPFGIAELLARVRAALRTHKNQAGDQLSEVVAGDLHIDLARHTVKVAGKSVKPTRKEFDILRLLVADE
jgi:two-component system KDP operon response regulator KdpE